MVSRFLFVAKDFKFSLELMIRVLTPRLLRGLVDPASDIAMAIFFETGLDASGKISAAPRADRVLARNNLRLYGASQKS
jgi:hypothetical protein